MNINEIKRINYKESYIEVDIRGLNISEKVKVLKILKGWFPEIYWNSKVITDVVRNYKTMDLSKDTHLEISHCRLIRSFRENTLYSSDYKINGRYLVNKIQNKLK